MKARASRAYASVLCAIAMAAFPSRGTVSADECSSYDQIVTTTPVPFQNAKRLAEHQEILNSAPRSADVIVVGDSIAAWWPKGLLDAAFPSSSILNIGVAGAKTQTVLWQLANPAYRKFKPKLVVIILGTNNLTEAPCAVAAGLLRVVEAINDLWEKPDIRLVQILPRGADLRF